MSNSIPCFAIWLNAVFLLLYTVNTFMTFGNCNRNCCRLCYHFHFLIQPLFMGFRAIAVTLRCLHIQIIRLSNHLVGLFLVIIIFVVVAVNAITISRPQHSLLAAHRSVQVFFSLCFVLCCIASMLQIKCQTNFSFPHRFGGHDRRMHCLFMYQTYTLSYLSLSQNIDVFKQ